MSDNSKPASEDLHEAAILIKEVSQHASNLYSSVQSLVTRAKNGEFNASKGISLLTVKSHMLLNYLVNVTYLILRKISGKKIEDDAAVQRLVELRTVLEKMRPIDQKLKYQVQKLITAANTGNINADDPLNFRANPENLVSQHEDKSDVSDSEEERNGEKKTSKAKAYVPPKISATFYDGDETQQSRQEKLLERVQKRALSSSVLEELRKEYDMGPEEIKEVGDLHKKKIHEEIKDRLRYEEEYMLRLPVTKKQKHDARKVTTISSLHNLAKFDDISALESNPSEIPMQKKRTSKKFSAKKQKGKRKSFKRKRH